MVKVYIAILTVSLVLGVGAEIVGKSRVFSETDILYIVDQTRYHCYRFSYKIKLAINIV